MKKMTQELLRLISDWKGEFRGAYSISGSNQSPMPPASSFTLIREQRAKQYTSPLA